MVSAEDLDSVDPDAPATNRTVAVIVATAFERHRQCVRAERRQEREELVQLFEAALARHRNEAPTPAPAPAPAPALTPAPASAPRNRASRYTVSLEVVSEPTDVGCFDVRNKTDNEILKLVARDVRQTMRIRALFIAYRGENRSA